MKMLLMLLILTATGLLWMRHENATLAHSFERANKVAGEYKTTITRLEKQLNTAYRITGENEASHAIMQGELVAAGEIALRREQFITRLLNENDSLHRWYYSNLPDVVRRLHQRAYCVDASACLQPLPKGQPLPNAGK